MVRRWTAPRGSGTPPPVIARLPHVSVIVPLYRERHIAQRLIRRLSRIDYPRELLQILLAVEAEDDTTRRALSQTRLPPWISPGARPRGRHQDQTARALLRPALLPGQHHRHL